MVYNSLNSSMFKQGRQQKIFQGSNEKKRPKISKKYKKIALFSLFQEGHATEKKSEE